MPKSIISFMTFTTALAHKQQLEADHTEASKRLRAVKGSTTVAGGLTPDHIKQGAEWKEAYATCEIARAKSASFNGAFVKHFKAEYRAHRARKSAVA